MKVFACKIVTVLTQYMVALCFTTLVFFARLSLKIVHHKLSFKGDYVSRGTIYYVSTVCDYPRGKL